jgi:hypothetical protein
MQPRQIPESDWKLWRRLREQALERFCDDVLKTAAKLGTGEGTSHARYLKLYELVTKRDKTLAEIFNDARRSNAFFQIALAVRAKLVTPTELAEFTDDTQAVIEFLS